MAEVKIAVGDEVRVHFHPPGAMKSYFEGVVSRVDVTTPEGRFFVVEVTHEVLLDREHRIRRGFPDFVRYECRNDFPGGTIGNFVWGHYDDLEGDIAWHSARNPAFPNTCLISCWPELAPNPRQQCNRSTSQTAHAAKFAKEPFSVADPRDL